MPSTATHGTAPAAVSTPAVSTHPATAAWLLGALGVVFGDIGTSPIYAFRETLRAAGAQATAAALPEARTDGLTGAGSAAACGNAWTDHLLPWRGEL